MIKDFFQEKGPGLYRVSLYIDEKFIGFHEFKIFPSNRREK